MRFAICDLFCKETDVLCFGNDVRNVMPVGFGEYRLTFGSSVAEIIYRFTDRRQTVFIFDDYCFRFAIDLRINFHPPCIYHRT